MTVRKFAISLLWMLLIYINASVDSSPQYNSAKKPLHQPLQPINDVDRISAKTVNETVLHFLEDYKRLRAKKSEEAMRTIATAGLVSGALKVEELIRDNLGHLTDDLIDNFNVSTPKENMDKLLALEEVMERDKSSIDVLMSALEFARNSKSYESFNEDMKRILKENKQSMEKLHKKKRLADQTMTDESDLTGNLMKRSQKAQKYELMEKVYDVKEMIDRHRNQIHSNVTKNAQETISFLRQLQKKNAALVMIKEANIVKRNPKQITGATATNGAAPTITSSAEAKQTKSNSLAGLLEVWKILRGPAIAVSVEQNGLVEDEKKSNDGEVSRRRRQDDGEDDDARKKINEDDVNNEIGNDDEKSGADKDKSGELNDDENGSEPESEEAGGLVGLIANLSGGDEGSDVAAVIGALSGVIANLLGPNGIDVPSVIGSATALLGGLLSNGQNFGNVLGSYAGLAVEGFSGGGGADPEDEDLPPKPGVFIENVFNGSQVGLARENPDQDGASSDTSSENHQSSSASFITHIITTIVGVITNAIASASLGSSGGSSHGVAGLFGGSSHGSSSKS